MTCRHPEGIAITNRLLMAALEKPSRWTNDRLCTVKIMFLSTDITIER
jgi:hypothetical protein